MHQGLVGKSVAERWWIWGLVVLVVAIDFYTKQLIVNAFVYGEHLTVTSFFDLVRYHNEGAAFSFLAAAGGWQKYFFSVIALIASVVIIHLIRKHSGRKLFCFALALILGGALGNLIDRLTLGYVVDFLFFHYQAYYWPAFNVADSAVTCGVVLLFWDSLKSPQKES